MVSLVTPAQGSQHTGREGGKRRRWSASHLCRYAHPIYLSLLPRCGLASPSTPEHLPLLKPGSKTPADQDTPAQMDRERARLERTSCTRSQVRNAAEKAADLCPSQVFRRKERKKQEITPVLSTAAALVIKPMGKSPLEKSLMRRVPEPRRCDSQGRVREWKTPASRSPSLAPSADAAEEREPRRSASASHPQP